MEVTLHAAPRWRDVALEQIRIVGLRLRREALIVAAIVVFMTVLIVRDIVRGNAGSWFDSDEWAPMGIAAFFLPFVVWRAERRFGPAFLWTLPVDRRRLALTKVFAGWVWLMTALVLLMVWQTLLAAVSGVAGAETVPILALSGTTALYLLGSALVLGLRHPLRWMFAALLLVALLTNVAEILGRNEQGQWRIFTWFPLVQWAVYGPYGVQTLLRSSGLFSATNTAGATWQSLPGFVQWASATFIWIGAAFAALWPAVSRHREQRRN